MAKTGSKKTESKDMFEMVKEFNEAFKVELNEKPCELKNEEYRLRYRLQVEEISEYVEACKAGDKVGILDSLVDQMYVLIGTIQKHGMAGVFNDAFKEVHESNMTKLNKDGEPILRKDGKIIKGENYKAPDLKKFL